MREIEIYVAASSEYYSFNIDENTPLAVIADEVSAMLRQKTMITTENAPDMIFYSKERGEILNGTLTLAQLGVATGSELGII